MKIVTADEMRSIERRSEAAGVSTATLMEQAGAAVAREAANLLGDPLGKRVLVLVGPGNNGGDGLVAARELFERGVGVTLYLVGRDVSKDGHFQETAVERGIPAVRAEDDPDRGALRRELEGAAEVIDALLGTGRARPITGVLKGVLEALKSAASRPIVLAVDLPTGANADTGAVDESTARADVTVTLGFPKVGLFAFPAAGFAGKLTIGDIGLPPHVADDVPLEMVTREQVAALLPARPAEGHKGTFGKVLVAGGCRNYTGAPVLASIAAGRVGAGLVTLACAASLHPIFAAKLTEATFLPLPDEGTGAIGLATAGLLRAAVEGYDVLLIGPGLGRADGTRALVPVALEGLPDKLSCVVDADGLNALAATARWWTRLPKRAVLTPHGGEMARLLGLSVEAVNADRLGKAREAAARSGTVIVLKGAFTVVAEPGGMAYLNPSANPALATAGTGDVLAGAIAGLLAQGCSPTSAAVAGVYLHCRAGELARDGFGDAGVLAGDLLPLLPRAIRETRQAKH